MEQLKLVPTHIDNLHDAVVVKVNNGRWELRASADEEEEALVALVPGVVSGSTTICAD
jgi:hypothetical protein